MTRSQTVRIAVTGTACLFVAACQTFGPDRSTPAPLPPVAAVAAVEPTPKSLAASTYYAGIQQVLLREGMLRTDVGEDVPVTSETLTENFMRIALFHEYRREKNGITRAETETPLVRWADPIRVGIRFGPSIAPEKQATDRARLASYLGRIYRITGHPISIDDANPNFWIYVVSQDEREAMEPTLRALGLGIDQDVINTITRMPQTTYCNVFGVSGAGTYTYKYAVAVIRAENPDLLRLSCFHEEIAQAMGLPNDSPRARPSIFNDDEEFALLTDQDELMLRILYSPELRPGMQASEVRPIVETLARRLTGGES